MSWRVGENIGPYQLLEKIGEGGMGAVFKAYHPALDRYVALKVIHPDHREDLTFAARFQREARVVAKLEHPNIVPVYDYAEYEGLAYLVMKYIEGTTLKNRLSQRPLNFYEILQVIDSVGSAVGYAHTQGVLHRDIKPSNVLIGVNSAMYLADFGLARIAHAEASTLSSDAALGTPHYVSPEQAMGRQDLDKRTDIYSFGVTLYELVVGQAPFHAKTGYAIIHDHIYTPPPLPRTLNPNLSESVEQVLLKALEKNPDDRFDTVDQLVLSFKNAWLNADTTTQGMTPPVSSAPYHRTTSNEYREEKKSALPKKRRMEWLYVLVGIALGIVLAFSLVPNLRGRMMGALASIKIPALSVELTPTGQGFSSTGTLTAQPSPASRATSTNTAPAQESTNTSVPIPTNTPAPKPTDRPTEPVQNILTPPPVIKTVVKEATEIPPVIETVVNQVTDIPPIIPSVVPLP